MSKQQGNGLPERIANLSPERLALLARRLERAGGRREGAGPIRPRAAEAGWPPASFGQERLWFLEQLQPGDPTYHIASALRLRGRLQVPALERSLAELVRRQQALRTGIRVVEGRPLQVVAPQCDLALPVVDLQGSPPGSVAALAQEESRLPFDLGRGPLLRARLLRLGEDDHVLLLVLHHIAGDGWSQGVLL